MDSNHSAGVLFGATIATYKSFLTIISTLGIISWQLVGETIFLTFLGGAVGWCGAEVMKLSKPIVKKFFSKLFKKYGKKD